MQQKEDCTGSRASDSRPASAWGRPPVPGPVFLPGPRCSAQPVLTGAKPCLPVASVLSWNSTVMASGQTQAPSKVYHWAL